MPAVRKKRAILSSRSSRPEAHGFAGGRPPRLLAPLEDRPVMLGSNATRAASRDRIGAQGPHDLTRQTAQPASVAKVPLSVGDEPSRSKRRMGPGGSPSGAWNKLWLSLAVFAQRPGRSVKDSTPAASARPVCPWTDRGCKVNARSEPPTRTFAPTPTPTVADASTPPYSPASA